MQGASAVVRVIGCADSGNDRALERVCGVLELSDAGRIQVVQTCARPHRRHPHPSMLKEFRSLSRSVL